MDQQLIPEYKIECPTCHEKYLLWDRQHAEYYGCGKCNALMHIVNTIPLSTGKTKDSTATCVFELGTVGELFGRQLRVLGFAQRQERASKDKWEEYFLRDELTGEYFYLSEYNGHWLFIETIPEIEADHQFKSDIGGSEKVLFRGEEFQKYHSYQAVYIHVRGEYPWNPTSHKNVYCREFINPPYLLSREAFGNDIELSLGTYLSPGKVRRAFKPTLAMPYRTGIGSAQPFPFLLSSTEFIRVAVLFAVFMLIFQSYYSSLSKNKDVMAIAIPVNDSTVGKPFMSPSFKLEGGTDNLAIHSYARIENAWAEAGIDLVNEQTGKEQSFAVGVEYYKGVEDGYAWSEGSYGNTETLCSIEDGNYHLVITPEKDPSLHDTEMTITLVQDTPIWWNAVWAVVLMALAAGGVYIAEYYYEQKRWY